MQRTPTTPDVGVEKRRYKVGQDGPSGTADQGISAKVVADSSRAGPPGTISLEQAKELLGNSALADDEVEEIKEQVRQLVEVIYEKWLEDQSKRQINA